MISPTRPSRDEWCACLALVIALFVAIVACTPDKTPDPPGCPIPQYSVNDTVLVDDVYISTIIEREVVGCGEIYYTVVTNVEDNGELIVLEKVTEDRIKPYEPEFP